MFQLQTMSRRSFLSVGTATIGGLTLADVLAAKESTIGAALQDRSVVVLNLQGGPTQFETFDPNMQAPREIRSLTGETATAIPGVMFGGTLPQLASIADKLSIVRSPIARIPAPIPMDSIPLIPSMPSMKLNRFTNQIQPITVMVASSQGGNSP